MFFKCILSIYNRGNTTLCIISIRFGLIFLGNKYYISVFRDLQSCKQASNSTTYNKYISFKSHYFLSVSFIDSCKLYRKKSISFFSIIKGGNNLRTVLLVQLANIFLSLNFATIFAHSELKSTPIIKPLPRTSLIWAGYISFNSNS